MAGQKIFNYSSEVQEMLAKISQTSYSVHGYLPSLSEWRITQDQIRDIVKATSKSFIDDIEDVTLDINHKTGAISAFVWIPRNSKHITNNDLNSNESAIKRQMIKYSDKMKEYMDKFCNKDERRIFREENNLPLAGIKVRLEVFMKIEFDENGYSYGKTVGNDIGKRKTNITLTCNFAKGDDGRFGKLNYLTIRKEVRSGLNTLVPRPRRSYNV